MNQLVLKRNNENNFQIDRLLFGRQFPAIRFIFLKNKGQKANFLLKQKARGKGYLPYGLPLAPCILPFVF